jgi:RHS repeat-associated protein
MQPAVWHGAKPDFRYGPTVSEWYRHLKPTPAAMRSASSTGHYRLTIHYTYDAHGHLKKVAGNDETHPYWTAQSADARGHVTSAAEGNGVTMTHVYDHATGVLTGASAGGGVNGSVQLAQYHYDGNGNLVKRQDYITGQSETYAYSRLNRLTGAGATLSDGTTATTLSASYDGAGNLTRKNGQTYSYSPNHPNRLSRFAGTSYQYDHAGRVLAGKDALSVGWTAFGKPYEITRTVGGASHETDFWYGPEQGRYKQVVDGTEEISLAGGAFEIVHIIGSSSTTYRMAIIAAGVVVGQIETSTDGDSAVHYFYRDHLGSVVAIADGSGHVTQRLAYGPYGARRKAIHWNQPLGAAVILGMSLPTDRGFTGQHALDALGLVDYGGRIYDLETGRFLSPDPTGAEPNPYAYARNNPATLIDPTGYFSLGDVVRVAAIATVAYFTAGAAAGAAGGWGTLGGSLAGGATGGFSAGFLGSNGHLRAWFYGAVSGAAFGGLGYGFGGHLTAGELVGRSVAEGAVGGLLSEAGGGNFGDGFLAAPCPDSGRQAPATGAWPPLGPVH